MKSKLIVLGSSGFIGKNLIDFFAKKKNFRFLVHIIKKNTIIIKMLNILSVICLKKNQVERALKGKDIVIIAAATTSGAKDIIERPYIHVTDNAIMNSVITRAAFNNKCKHVIF